MTTEITTLETVHLRATRAADEHFRDLCGLWGDSRVMAQVGGVRTEEQCRAMLQSMHDHWAQYGFGRWVWHEKSSGAFVGLAGLRCMIVDEWPEVTLGYLLKPDFWGKGYATEMAGCIAALAFERLGMESLIALAAPENTASRRVMEKIGMKYNREGLYENLPHVLYEITRGEWVKIHPSS